MYVVLGYQSHVLQRCDPACSYEGSSYLSPVLAYDFLSRCKFSTLTPRQPSMVEVYLHAFSRFPLRKKQNVCACVCVCVCLCVFFPFILDVKFVGCTSRGHTGGRSHRISHPSCRRFLESVISVSSDFIFVFIDTAPPSACAARFGVPGSISSDNKF